MTWTDVSIEKVKDSVDCGEFFLKLFEINNTEVDTFKKRLEELKSEQKGLEKYINREQEELIERCALEDKESVEKALKDFPLERYKAYREGLLRKLNHSSSSDSLSLDRMELFLVDYLLSDESQEFYQKNKDRENALFDLECIRKLELTNSDIERYKSKRTNSYLLMAGFVGFVILTQLIAIYQNP